MADSPSENASEVVKLSLKVSGTDVTDNVQIVSVSVHKEVNRIASAKVQLIDGDMPEQSFPQSDKTDFAPGETIEILAGYGDDEATIFSGIILRHGVSIDSDNNSFLVLDCKDAAIKMTIASKNANYVKLASGDTVKDSTVIGDIIGNYADLASDVDSTTAELEALVQYNATDWDFVAARAEANAMLLLNSDGKLSVKKPDLTTSAVLTVTYGQDIYSFSAELDPSFQFSQVTGASWDPATQANLEEAVSAESDSSEQAKTNGDLSSVIGLSDFRLQTQAQQVSQSLKDWATSQLTKSRLSLIRGNVSFQGSSKVAIGAMLELKSVGKRFSGNVFISAFDHDIRNGGWVTEATFGCSPHWFHAEKDIQSSPAAGLLPSATGLQIGVVKKLDEDPNGEYRIQVTVPLLSAEKQGIWARMAHYYASNSFGAFFIPEIGDEVVLGYLNNDPGYPIILGSLYSSKNKAPLDLTADNYTKLLQTKSSLKVSFDDEKKIITLETPGGHSIVMDDDAKKVTVTDSNSNVMEMSDSGLSLTSPKDIALKADGKITLTATGNIEGKATGDAKLQGMNLSLTADTALTAKGNASAEVSASGTTTIKGAMVMIN
ncbi:MAG: type VI secretion system tip protein VgrG [Reinekea sp.]